MTPKERIQRAISHEKTDICPYILNFKNETRKKLVGFTGDEYFDREVETHTAYVGRPYPETNERLDESRYTDAFGVIWEESIQGEIGVVANPILEEPSLRGYRFPETRIPGLFDTISEQLSAHPELFHIWSLGFSLYERAWSLRGMENLLVDMVERPRFAAELLDRICEFNLDLIEQACQFGIDCVRFGDDWGSQRGLIMGPDLWRRFIKPRFSRMVGLAASRGKPVFLHSDGDIEAIIPDLIEIGLTVLNPVQPDVMDIYKLKREYGKNLTFLGGVSVQSLLPRSGPDEVRTEVRRLISEVGAGGGFIISPTHSLGSEIPPENR